MGRQSKGSSKTGRCPCSKYNEQAELIERERQLEQREMELISQQKILQKQVNEFKKKRDNKAKKDLIAAKKLKDARLKLQMAVDARDKIEKKQRRIKDSRKCLTEPPCKWYNKINKALEKFNSKFDKSCFCQSPKIPKFEVYPRKIMNSSYCERGDNSCRIRQPCCGSYRPRRHSCLESAGEDCYELAMQRSPYMYACKPPWSLFYPRDFDCRRNYKNLGLCCMFLASFLLWAPCLLFVYLCLCCCCSSD